MAYFLSTDGQTTETIPSCEGPLKKPRTGVSPKAILERNARAATNKAGILRERVEQVQAHDAKVKAAQDLKAAFAKTGMEIMGAGEPVELPARLQAKLAEAPSHSHVELIQKEAKAAAAREVLLSATVAQAQAHHAKVKAAQAVKATFAETGMEILGAGEPVELPARLQARLDALPKHTADELLQKEARAAATREHILNERVAAAAAHAAKGSEVRERKGEFAETGMEILDNGKKVALPAHLKARLAAAPKPLTPEETLAREAKARATRDAVLEGRVAQAQAHDAVVAERRSAKKRKAAECAEAAPQQMEE